MTRYQVIVSTYDRQLGGVETFCDNLVDGLLRSGVPAVRLLTEGDPRRGPPPTRGKNVPTERLRLGPWATWHQRWEALGRYLQERAPCVFIPNDDQPYNCIGPALPAGVQVAGIIHNDSTWHYDQLARVGQSWDAVVAVSPTIARQAHVVDPSLASRISYIPYGVPVAEQLPERNRGPGEPLRVIYAGRVQQHQKRVFDLLRIVAGAEAEGVPIDLTIVGAGDDLAALRTAFAPQVARGSVRFTGTLSNGDVIDEFAKNDVVILTSSFEGLPLMLLEAMGQGCVPVVSDIRSGIPEVITDGVQGFRVPVGGTRVFTERLGRLHRDQELRARMSASAHHAATTGGYRVQDMVARYVALCDTLTEGTVTNGRARRSGPIRPPVPLKGQTWLPHPLWLGEQFLFGRLRRLFPSMDGSWAGRNALPGFEWKRP